MLTKFFHSGSGTAAIQYGLIAAFSAAAGVTALPAMNDFFKETFGTIGDQFPTTRIEVDRNTR